MSEQYIQDYKNKLQQDYNIKIFTDNLEYECLQQTELLLKQEPFKDCKIRLMPNTHAGKGCVIGFTADLGNKVIPNIVGVDIGCGMLCVELGKIDLDLEELDNRIKECIPSGRNIRTTPLVNYTCNNLYCYDKLKDTSKFSKSIGTLGGGNHFIEVDVDDEGNKYLVIHTGSRNLGKQVAEYYQNLAIDLCSGKGELCEEKQKLIKEYKAKYKQSEIQQALKELDYKYSELKPEIPDDLCYLTGDYRYQYIYDMIRCQEYASLNRKYIAFQILNHIFEIGSYTLVNLKEIDIDRAKQIYLTKPIGYFETIHNYISSEDNIVRKGAISAKQGEKVLIPINMRDGSIIAIGKGNED